MEQTTQQVIQKPPFPIKTKVAAWWLIMTGGLESITCLFFIMLIMSGSCWAGIQIPIILFFPSFLTFLSGFFLLKRKKWFWWFIIILLFIEVFLTGLFTFFHVRACIRGGFPIVSGYVILPFLFLLPFILLLLDRKNFFKIVS